jgi:hypothetical protein
VIDDRSLTDIVEREMLEADEYLYERVATATSGRSGATATACRHRSSPAGEQSQSPVKARSTMPTHDWKAPSWSRTTAWTPPPMDSSPPTLPSPRSRAAASPTAGGIDSRNA